MEQFLAPEARIRSLPTEYAGCLFRSRTEARWALALDELGIAWEYEVEGFALDVGAYLPDFYLPAWKVWLEIKGPHATEREQQLAAALARSRQEWVVIFVGNPPWGASPYRAWGPAGETAEMCWFHCSTCGFTGLLPHAGVGVHPGCAARAARDAEQLKQAFKTSRSWRFEPRAVQSEASGGLPLTPLEPLPLLGVGVSTPSAQPAQAEVPAEHGRLLGGLEFLAGVLLGGVVGYGLAVLY